MSKVIIIGPAYPLRGGLATFDERMARQFMSEGHEVTIYTFSLQYPDFLFPGKTQYSESAPPDDLNIKVAINSVNPFNWWKVGKQLKKEKADIIITRYWLPFMGPCLGSILRIAKVRTTCLIGLIDNALPHEKRPGDRLFTNYFTGSLDGFISMSKYVAEDLRQFTSKPIQLVQHPLYDNFGAKVDKTAARKQLRIPENGYIFLFFGFIRKYKGLDLLLDALPLVQKSGQSIYLLIAGEYYAGEDEIKQQISDSPSAQMIIQHTHFIKNEEVALYFSAADCVIQPYRNATQSGVTPLAYHFEKPMIVTNVGALPDLVPSTLGYVCEPTPNDIAKTMDKMPTFDHPAFAIAIQEEKKKLSWAKLTSIIYSIKENVHEQ